MKRTSLAALAAIAAMLGSTLSGQQQPPVQRAEGQVQSGVSAVLVDVVVRDRRGEPVRDLRQGEIQVFEDGVPQAIGSFNAILEDEKSKPAAAAPASSALPSAPVAPAAAPLIDDGPTVTALVFDRLSPEGQKFAVIAAQNYLGTKTETPGYIGIFGIDLALSPFAPFTRSTRVLKQGLDKMNQRATGTLNSEAAREKASALGKAAAGASAATASAESSAGAGGSGVGTGAGDAMLAQMQSDMIRGFDSLDRDQSGYLVTNGLFAIIGQMRRLPGRKSIVMFSEGLALPPAVVRQFEAVIAAANRANVSIYTMDAAGLRAESDQAKIRDQVNEMAAGGGGILGGGKTTSKGPLSKSLENNEDVLKQDPRNGLGTLAQGTGGVAFDSTNNLRHSFERVESDLHNYYLIGYSPTNDKFDGKFREITVKVNRPGVTVAARKGYYAVRDTGASPVNEWEALALGALESKPVPNAFPVRASAMLFPERDRLGLVPVVVDFKMAPLSLTPSADGKTFATDFSVLVRFLDAANQTVKKVSQNYNESHPIENLERAKQAGEVLFYREPELAPGVYTMETVIYDRPSNKASVRFTTVEVPKADAAALRMSSLILTGRAEKVPDRDRRKDNPFQVNDVLIYPNIGEPVSKKAKEVGFMFTVYPASGAAAPEAVLDLIQNGKVLGQLPLPLEKADASGRIQQTGRLPLEQLAPGTYELRVVVKQGVTQLARTVLLRLTE